MKEQNIANRLRNTTPVRYALLFGAVASLLWSAPGTGSAASIGVDFAGPMVPVLGPTDVAGAAPFAQANYNSVSAVPTNFALKDNTGAATTATLTTTGSIIFSFLSNAPVGADEVLNSSFVNSGSWSFTLNNIPYANYSIVVYGIQFRAAGNPDSLTGIGIGGTTYYTNSPVYNTPGYLDGNAATPYLYTRSTGTTSATATPMSDYVLFTGLTGSSATVNVSLLTPVDARVSGFQIVENVIPEPSTWALLLLGGFGLLVLARMRRVSVK